MKKTTTLISLILLIAMLLCGCGGNTPPTDSTDNTGPVIELDAESEKLLEEIGDDLHAVMPDQFAETVTGFTSADVGKVYQLVGYYEQTEGENEAVDSLTNKDGSTSIQLRYLYEELTQGDCYSITGILAEETHGDHHHLYFDVIAIETYQS